MIKKATLLLTIGIFALPSLPLPAYAGCQDAPTRIEKNAKAPCRGWIMNDSTELKIRTDLVYYKGQVKNYEKRSELQEKLLELADKRAELYSNKLDRRENWDKWEKLGYFSAGAVLTMIIAYGAARSVR